MAQLVRAPPCHGGGRGFESLLGRFALSCKLQRAKRSLTEERAKRSLIAERAKRDICQFFELSSRVSRTIIAKIIFAKTTQVRF